MEPPIDTPFEMLEYHLEKCLRTRLGRAILGDLIADQLLATEAAPLPESVDDLNDAVNAALASNTLSDAAIRNIFFLAVAPGKPRVNHGPTPPLEPDSPMFSDEELLDHSVLLSYPQLPYYREVSKVLRLWMKQRQFPFEFVPLGGLVETSNEPQRMELHTADVRRLADAWHKAEADADRSELTLDLLKLLGVRGILTLLRVRRTMGTTTATLPPAFQRLVWAFNSTGKGRSTLTEGARAVSKHYHRDSTNRFWGDNKGSDAQKNQHANVILRRIFRESVWINVHLLPHDITICEVRTPAGYGARWSGDGSAFRGFLEPHVEDGHEKGWKH